MSFNDILIAQIRLHPSAQPQDIVKLCYQAAYGVEHLLSNADGVWEFLKCEYASVEPDDVPLAEQISDRFCRINLARWKHVGFPLQWLFRMFVLSATTESKDIDVFDECLQTAEVLIEQGDMMCSPMQWRTYLKSYAEAGMGPVHHSTQYRMREKPAYRVVANRYARLIPILEQIFHRFLPGDQRCVIAIDGRAAAGKSTMASDLQKLIGADTIHMDDFFLPMELRTEKRIAQPGGNVHYERFAEEVLPFLSQSDGFSYRRFDCSKMDFNGERVVGGAPVRIVEGAYSHHWAFGHYADITVFADVDPGEQMRRICERNGIHMAEIFQTRWIPLEEQYIAKYEVKQKADIVL